MITDRRVPTCHGLELTVERLGSAFAEGTATPIEMVEALLERAESDVQRVFLTLNADEATAVGSASTEMRSRSNPLQCIPIAVKDNFATQGLRTTAGSKALGDWLADEDAAVVRALRSSGAIVVGKTNMDEFAYGPLGTGSAFGPTLNPLDNARVAGGSSGGSAAAIAAGLCVAAVGTDTAGSVRIPAAFCGVVGLKPTLGTLSCQGIVPLSRSQDHVGILANSVTDVAVVWEALRNKLPRRQSATEKAASSRQPRNPTRPLQNLRLGISDYFGHDLDDDIRSMFQAVVGELEQLGAAIDEISLDLLEDTLPVGAVLLAAEATFYHANALRRFGDLYGEEVRARLLAGYSISGVDYVRAVSARARLVREYQARTGGVDAVICPTTATTAPLIDTLLNDSQARETARRRVIRFTRPFNVLGAPALTMPCGRDRHALPIGLQIVGRPHAEDLVLGIASAYERSASLV